MSRKDQADRCKINGLDFCKGSSNLS